MFLSGQVSAAAAGTRAAASNTSAGQRSEAGFMMSKAAEVAKTLELSNHKEQSVPAGKSRLSDAVTHRLWQYFCFVWEAKLPNI